LVVLDPATLALKWASFPWQRFDVAPPAISPIALLLAAS